MRLQDLHVLPKVRDSLSYLYVEHCRVEQDAKAIAIHDKTGITPVPCASLSYLMLGPGTTITHAAVLALADNGCLVGWCGEQGVRLYAAGTGETRQATNLMHQARLWSRMETRLAVVRQMYQMRFAETLDDSLSLEQIRGKEGVRVREAYARWSRETGVPWTGRNYDRGQWRSADPINRALSSANSCLYGICHSAIVAAGYSPGLGFIHTGKQLSFVYDVADLYKVDVTIPVAFATVAAVPGAVEREVRLRCRDAFAAARLLERIVDDMARLFELKPIADEGDEFAADPAKPGELWDPESGGVSGGVSYGEGGDEKEEDDGGVPD